MTTYEPDGADLLAQAAKEARDAAFTELEWTAERIISGDLPHDNGNVSVKDDEPIYPGAYIYHDPGDPTRTCLASRWVVDPLPEGVEANPDAFDADGGADGQWGDVPDHVLDLTDEERSALAEWIAAEVAIQWGDVPDRVLDFTDEERASLADKAHAEGEVARASTQWATARAEAAAAKARLVGAAQAAVQMGVPVAAVARAADTSRTRVYEWLNTR